MFSLLFAVVSSFVPCDSGLCCSRCRRICFYGLAAVANTSAPRPCAPGTLCCSGSKLWQPEQFVITGGAGFIGVNAAEGFIRDGWQVILFDNLSRKGTDLNLRYLRQKYPDNCEFIMGDVRYDSLGLLHAVSRADLVLHLAAQVAVTTSIVRPIEDFEINAHGTFNVLEAVRESGKKPMMIYSSTNKVYGGMPDIVCMKGADPLDLPRLP